MTVCTRNCDCVGLCKMGLDDKDDSHPMTTDRNSEFLGIDMQGMPIYSKSRTVTVATTVTIPPPASIPVAGLEALVERLRKEAAGLRHKARNAPDYTKVGQVADWLAEAKKNESFADELAQLIQEAK